MPEAGQDDAVQNRRISGFGVASAIAAVIALTAAGLIAVMWSGHRSAEAERAYQTRVLQVAAQWTGILINLNADNVEAGMTQLRDGTVGELNSSFDSSIASYREVVRKLRSRTTGQVESVSIEVTHRDLDSQPGQAPPTPAPLPPELAARTDTVLVVATSVSENAGAPSAARPGGADRSEPAGPTTVRWNLRLGISEVDGTPMVSRLESVR